MTLPADIASCHQLILEQQQQITVLQQKLLELESRLNQNSKNSHRPPSSEGLGKRPAIPKAKGKRGGQKGHRGNTLAMVSEADEVKLLLPGQCACGHHLDLSALQVELVERRQVFDLPEPKLVVTEYQKLRCTCPVCQGVNEGVFPADAKSAVQYGNGVRALVVLLNIGFKLPFKKIRTFFADLFGYAINEGTQIKANERCHVGLEQSEAVIQGKVEQSPVAHFDESGMRVAGKLHWLHTACTAFSTYLFIHPKRGGQAIGSPQCALPRFRGWAIHDCLKIYFSFTQCLHGICGAHLLRELAALTEQGSHWAAAFRRYLLTLYHLSEQGKGVLAEGLRPKALRLYEKMLDHAEAEEPPPKRTGTRGRAKSTKGRNLLNRLREHQTAVLAFAWHEEVPFTNNQAERDLRPAKIKQKVAGCFRTLEGAQMYARIQGFISTTRKHQLNVFNELRAVFEDSSFLTAPRGC